ncbi:MAG: lipid-binding SYLF domain-containing protein [Steroidobacteraceae bacterium]
MLSKFRSLLALPLLLAAIAHVPEARAQAREEARLLVATEVLDELRDQRDQVIPERLLQRAYGVAIIPDVTKVAFVVGGRHGNGVMVVRDSKGRFTSPVFVNLTGGSVGWQIGAQSTDIVLVFTSRRGIEGIADGKLTLGAGASVAAGPVGRAGEAAAGMNAEVFSYSRNRGLFAGVALDGTALTMDNKANANFYAKRGVLASDIMAGSVTKNSENVRRLLRAIASSTGETATLQTTGETPAPAPNAPAQPAPANNGGVRTFPMEDPTPGGEPR